LAAKPYPKWQNLAVKNLATESCDRTLGEKKNVGKVSILEYAMFLIILEI